MENLIKTIVGGIIIFAVCLALTSCFGGCMPDYSEGTRAGELVKFSHKGIFWKSWEGELIINEFRMKRKGNNDSSNVFEFSCTEKSLAEEIEKCVGANVRLHYKQYLIGPITQSTGYVITKVEILKD